MKVLKKILMFVSVSAMVFSLMNFNTYAAEAKKGTVRIVAMDKEISASEDELIYNGHKYLPSDYLVKALILPLNRYSIGSSRINNSNSSITYYLSPSGYVSFFNGSINVRIGDQNSVNDGYLKYPAALYDGKMYVSADDIAYVLKCNYGYDASKNTIYFTKIK